MEIEDKRKERKQEEFKDMNEGAVFYNGGQLQMKTDENTSVCLEDGVLQTPDGDDEFVEIKAKVVIS